MMRFLRWGVGVVVAGAVAGAIVLGVTLVGGTAQAQTGPGDGKGKERLAQILATNLGLPVDKVQSALDAAHKQIRDELVASGQLRQRQPGHRLGGRFGFRGGIVEAAAKTIGLSVEVVRNEMKQGKSLVTIAAERGVSEQQLKTGILNADKARLDQAVQAGRITRQQADTMLQQLSERIDQAIKSTAPVR